MKQPKRINFKMLLIAVLALIMTFALVACNGDKKDKSDNNNNNSENMEMTEASKQLIEQSRSDFDAMFNYFLTKSETLTADEELYMRVQFTNGDLDHDIAGGYALCGIETEDSDISVYVFESEDDAKKGFEEYKFPDENTMRVGNKVIYNYTQYQQILDSTRPASITKFTTEQVAFMESKLHRGVDKKEKYNLASFDLSNNLGNVMWSNTMLYGNCTTLEAIAKRNASDIEDEFGDDELFMSINYTDDSYVRYDKATGIVSAKLTNKPGRHVEKIRDYQHDDAPTGKYLAEYYYNEAPSTLTILTKIGNYDIDEAFCSFDGFYYKTPIVQSAVIEKAISEVSLYGNIKQITIPVSDKAFVEIDDNTTLETINFGGTMDQWEALYGRSAQEWMHVYDDVEDKYVDITFTVHCTNGSITYPKTNA